MRQIRLNDEYLLLRLPERYTKSMLVHDAQLYVSLLDIDNIDWRLPTYYEAVTIGWPHSPMMWLCIINDIDGPVVLGDNNHHTGFVMPVYTKYHPTIIRRILLWLKNTTVANIVRKS